MLFLDELGELPLDIQAKLLRVVEDQEIIPEGADRPTSKADMQLIAATGRDLPAMIRRGRFRAELFYRLSGLRITVPPLRDRPDDLDTLIDHTLTELANEGCPRKLTAHERRQLHAYEWPGNVRQLIQVLRRTAYLGLGVADVLAEERRLGLHVHEEQADTDWSPGSAEEVLPFDEVRRRYAQRALSACGGSLQAAARALDVSVNTLKGWLADRPKGRKRLGDLDQAIRLSEGTFLENIREIDRNLPIVPLVPCAPSSGTVEATGSWTAFKTVELGRIRIAEAGKHELALRAQSLAGEGVMNLKSVVLKP